MPNTARQPNVHSPKELRAHALAGVTAERPSSSPLLPLNFKLPNWFGYRERSLWTVVNSDALKALKASTQRCSRLRRHESAVLLAA